MPYLGMKDGNICQKENNRLMVDCVPSTMLVLLRASQIRYEVACDMIGTPSTA